MPNSSPKTLRAACVQLTSGEDIGVNLATAAKLVSEAALCGAQIVALPENVARMTLGRSRTLAGALPESEHPALPFFADLARRHDIWLLAGSIAVTVGPERLANRSLLFAPDGQCIARYDKIHLFDVDLANGESYRESALFESGTACVLAHMTMGPFSRGPMSLETMSIGPISLGPISLGMSICYDLRFPQLYRTLAKAGAHLIAVPSAFTRQTGEAHWHTLLRARAIETGCFVLAPAQTGVHPHGRETYGHALIVTPWGEILADAGTEPGIIWADLDLDAVDKSRQAIPSLKHDRDFTLRQAWQA